MKNTKENLTAYIDAGYPIIYINHFNFKEVDDIIKEATHKDIEIREYSNSYGYIDFNSKKPYGKMTLAEFLDETALSEDGYEKEIFLVLKEVDSELKNPEILSRIRRIVEKMLYDEEGYSVTIFIVSSKIEIPKEIENFVSVIEIPVPDQMEIKSLIEEFCRVNELDDVEEDLINELLVDFRGLSKYQIEQILRLAYVDGGTIKSEHRELILQEKEQVIKKSGMLEIINFKENIDDIGGLENLKEWLVKKAKVFEKLGKALKFGVDIPKGIMIVGMPGCGKSLSAKAVAKLFKVPLIRLDVGRLLGKYVGESEENMRKALNISEQISPCVLWIDEVEKAFAGIGESGGASDITTRLFGQFLTWVQEKESTVFIVATANDISKLPAEFLRKGRFDELFFVDLPNEDERKKIFEIHLNKRKKWNSSIDISKLVKESNSFNGADIEAVIKESIENAFIEDKKEITTEDILKVIKTTKSISSTMKDKIESIRKTIEKIDIKPASR